MPHDLERFLTAQAPVYGDAIAELGRGHKTGHWMWFVFPQLAGLGQSSTSRTYAIAGLEQARAYLAHPVLGARLRACAEAVLANDDRTAEGILGSIDAVKLRSCMTLFHRAAPDEAVFAEVLRRFYAGIEDETTTARIGDGLNAPE